MCADHSCVINKSCGNSTCERDKGEDCGTCAQDCKCSNGRTCKENRCVISDSTDGGITEDNDNGKDGCGCSSDNSLPVSPIFFVFSMLIWFGFIRRRN